MKPPEERAPDDPQEWIDYARSDLALARNRLPGVRLELLCFHAQQAAEKALKGLLIKRGVDFPYVHDIGALLALLAADGENVPSSFEAAAALTPYAAEVRYPGIVERMDDEAWSQSPETWCALRTAKRHRSSWTPSPAAAPYPWRPCVLVARHSRAT